MDLKTKFKQTEIRRIPDDWKIKTIGDIAELYRENFTPINDDIRPYIGLEHIGQGTLDLVGIGSSLDVKSNKLIFEKGNILFGKLRPYFKKVVLANFDGICSTDIFVIRPKNLDYYNKFIFYLFSSDILVNLATSASEGTKMPRASWNFLKKQTFAIPPYHEQQQIGDALNSLDQKISLNRQMNATLEAIGQAIFKHWFVDFEFPNEDGKPYRSSGGEMVDSELGEVPEGWRVGSILEIAELLSGGTPKTKIAEYWGGEIPWVSSKDVTNARSTFILDTEKTITRSGIEHSNTKMLPKNTTIVTARGTVGSYCILSREMTINQTNYGTKAKSEVADFFVFFSVSNLVNQMKMHSYGTVFDTITTKTFKDMEIPIPPESMIKSFDNKVSSIMNQVLHNLYESSNLATIRDALLPKLMSGEIRVPLNRGD